MRGKDYWKNMTLLNELQTHSKAEQLLDEVQEAYLRAYRNIMIEINELLLATQEGEELSRTQLWNYARQKELKRIIEAEFSGLSTSLTKETTVLLEDVYKTTLAANAASFQKQFIRPNKHQVRAVVNADFHGRKFSERIWKNNKAIAQRVQQDLEDMVVRGKSPDIITRQIQKDFNVSYGQAKRLVHTEATRVFSQANEDSYKKYGVNKIEFNAEHDACSQCKELNGKVYDRDKAPKPPIHPNCRCVHIPIVGAD